MFTKKNQKIDRRRPDYATTALQTATVVGTAALILALLYFIYYVRHLLSLVFLAVLLSLLLRMISRVIARWTRLPTAWAVTATLVALLAACAGGGFLLVPGIVKQVAAFTQQASQAMGQLNNMLQQTSWGKNLLSQVNRNSLGPVVGDLLGNLRSLFSGTMDIVTSVIIIVFIAIYAAYGSDLYIRGALRLVPAAHRPRASQLIASIGYNLEHWLIGRLLAMAAVTGMTFIGLLILGVPLPLSLAIISGLLTFIPFLGPALAALPAMLFSVQMGWYVMMYVAVMYLLVHSVEGYLLTPVIQHAAVRMPPVLLIFMQISMAVLVGPLGVIIAGPVTVVLMVAVNMLYIESTLGEPGAMPERKDHMQ